VEVSRRAVWCGVVGHGLLPAGAAWLEYEGVMLCGTEEELRCGAEVGG
jgi:hypothetical protein